MTDTETNDEHGALLFNAKESLVNDTVNSPNSDNGEPETQSNSVLQTLAGFIQGKMSGSEKEVGLTWITALPIMVSMSYGSAIIILPYTLRQLGIVLWVIFTMSCFLMLAFSAVLLKEACVYTMKKCQGLIADSEMICRPYPKIAEQALGKNFSKLVEGTLYVALTCEVLAFMLLAATTMNDVLPLNLSYYNRIRVWLLIGYIVIMPFLMIGTYKDLVTPALIAVGTSMIASGCTLLVCIAAKYYDLNEVLYVTKDTGSKEYLFKIFGEILFAAGGPALLIPNIIVLMKKPESSHVPILWSHAIVVCIYSVLAIVPYVIFGQYLSTSITGTLSEVIAELQMSPMWLAVLTIAEISLTVHFTMVSILSANPVFLSFENHFNITNSKYTLLPAGKLCQNDVVWTLF